MSKVCTLRSLRGQPFDVSAEVRATHRLLLYLCVSIVDCADITLMHPKTCVVCQNHFT